VSEQALDFRSAWAVARRRAGWLVLAGIVGAVDGGLALSMRPPVYSSTSKVLLPAVVPGSTVAVPAHDILTQVRVATSETVLGPAGRAVTPQLSAKQVADRVTVEAETSDLLSITAKAPTPAAARELSGAVAQAEITYLKTAANAVDDRAQAALTNRLRTMEDSLDAVKVELGKTAGRLRSEPATSAQGKADAAALAELTAQQANLVLQIDKVKDDATSRSVGRPGIAATLIEPPSAAVTTSVLLGYALFGLGGAGAGVLLAWLILLALARRERAVRTRDQIADAIGIPVVASIQSRAPRSVGGWTSLLRSYAPHSVEMWSLRQLVRLVTPGHPGSLAQETGEEGGAPAVVVVTLSGDSRALAIGPQLAAFAASGGLRTQMVTGLMHESANALRAACAALAPDEEIRPRLRVSGREQHQQGADLVVHIAVVDRQRPDLALGVGTAVVLLAVTAGAATAEDLARVALAADDAGHQITYVIVVDPDPLDHTTGRLLPAERAAQVSIPSLMTGAAITSPATARLTRRGLR
jgi:capsular polysaccharide biosynthesis protein